MAGKRNLKDIVPDNGKDVLNHVKTALGYMYFHPGKKLINIKECSRSREICGTDE